MSQPGSIPRPALPVVEGASFSGTHVPLIERYLDRLPFLAGEPLVSLQEGSTPLLRAPVISAMVGASVRLKLEGANPTGSFKDRGMTCAVSDAVRSGAPRPATRPRAPPRMPHARASPVR
jgi:threonine synthase